jgi:cysteine desulfurase
MTNDGPVYLDCAATTPLHPGVREVLLHYLDVEYGNEGSRTHSFGAKAKRAVQVARDQIARAAKSQRDEIIFTSGATESNNMAILGLEGWASRSGKRHILSTQIEHKSVLEPLEELRRRGFEVQLLPPNSQGWVEAERVWESLRSDTALVTIMHANNETGVIQPIEEIAKALTNHEAYFHVDAAQTFGKLPGALQNPRVDLISLSAHKIFGPKGVGGLVARRRRFDKVPLTPLNFGGGQERGLRPGTLPVPLIAGLGLAVELAMKEGQERLFRCQAIRKSVISALMPLNPQIHGDLSRVLPHILNLSFPGLDSEAAILALKEDVAISNGSACTSANYTPSHVLAAMNIPKSEILGAIRLSWSHMTPDLDWPSLARTLRQLF